MLILNRTLIVRLEIFQSTIGMRFKVNMVERLKAFFHVTAK